MPLVKGYSTITDPTAAVQERDTCLCGHCQKVIFLKPGTASTVYLIPTRTPGQWIEEPGAFCRCCMRPVCLPCHDQGGCRPIEQWFAQQETRR